MTVPQGKHPSCNYIKWTQDVTLAHYLKNKLSQNQTGGR